MAAQLQTTYFPSSYPVFSNAMNGRDDYVEFDHQYRLGGAVGGDFCSVRKLSDTEAGLFICDVMGHGMRAALVTASIRAMVEEISHQKKDPAEFLEHMNQILMPILRQDDMFLFATACYMVLDVSTGKLRYAGAGHPSPIIFDTRTAQPCWLKGDGFGPALAVNEDPGYRTAEHALHPGDTVFLVTDGVYEITCAGQEELGEERLLSLVRQCGHLSLKEMFPTLLGKVCEFALL